MMSHNLNDPVVNAIDQAWQKKELLEAILPHLEPLVEKLIEDPPILYEDEQEMYYCRLCFTSVPGVFDSRGALQECDIVTFPHDRECAVERAKRIQGLLSSS